jgi:glyoxylase-like metal-dependent hydrolase (beta-lactamase superfamily II)
MTRSPPRPTRRDTLLAGLGGGVALSASVLSASARAASGPVAATDLGGGLALYGGAGGNVLALRSGDGLLLVDGGLAERSGALLQAVRETQGNGPVRYLFNTHWHLDHTGSNASLAAAGARIVAHENTRLWMGQEIVCAWENRTYPPQPAKALPTETFFYDSKELSLGPARVEYGYLPQAHTDGDIYVRFPAQNVIAAGDVVTGGRYPILDYSTNGWLGGMIDGLKAILAKCDDHTRVVPGTGGLRSKAEVQAQLDMCQAVYKRIADSYYKGETWEQFLAGKPTAEFDAQWGAPDTFLATAYKASWYHITEVRRPR